MTAATVFWLAVYGLPWALLTPWGDRLARRATVAGWDAVEAAQRFVEAHRAKP